MGSTSPPTSLLDRVLSRMGLGGEWSLIPLAALIGCLGGSVALLFDWLVEASGAFFFGRVARQSFVSGWVTELLMMMLLPSLGGLAVGLFQVYVSGAGPGHGVPDVIEAMARRRGRLPLRSGVFKMITASLTIGSGGSAGMEGPIIQIGSVVGSNVGRRLRVSRSHMNTLVGCGAAAGLAGIFNAPIAGVMFVLEVLLRDFSPRTFVPIVISAVFGAAITQAALGHNDSMFRVPELIQGYRFSELWLYALLGVVCGLVGYGFTRMFYGCEHLWERSRLPRWSRPAVGGAMLGGLGIVFFLTVGRPVSGYQPPVFFGNGYEVIESLFNPLSYGPVEPGPIAAGSDPAGGGVPAGGDGVSHGEHGRVLVGTLREPLRGLPIADATLTVLALSLGMKFVGTMLTLGSGGSGGVFAPSLFMGATLGSLFGVAAVSLGLAPSLSPGAYALAGMAGFLAATVHCPLTAFLLIFELTRDYQSILPVMLVAILATFVAQLLLRDSIYTLSLRERGLRLGTTSDLTLLPRLEVANLDILAAAMIQRHEPVQRLIELAQTFETSDFVVTDDHDRYVGLVAEDDLRSMLLQPEAVPLMIVEEMMRSGVPTVRRDFTLDLVLDIFSRHDVSQLAVVDERNRVLGTISRAGLMKRYQSSLES